MLVEVYIVMYNDIVMSNDTSGQEDTESRLSYGPQWLSLSSFIVATLLAAFDFLWLHYDAVCGYVYGRGAFSLPSQSLTVSL